MEDLVVCANKKFTLDKFDTQMKLIVQKNIKKILNISAKSLILSCECGNCFVAVSGKTLLEVVYLGEDNEVESDKIEADFIEKQKCDENLFDLIARDEVSVQNISFSANEIVCFVSHLTNVFGLYKCELPNFADDLDLVSKQKQFDGLKFICSANDVFSVAEEDEINLTNAKILSCKSNIVLDNVVCTVDKIVVEGRVKCSGLAESDSKICPLDKEIDFKQEIKAENVVPNMKAKVWLDIKNVNVSFENKDGKDFALYNIELIAKAYVYEEASFVATQDLFSLSNEIKTTYNFVESNDFVCCENQKENVSIQSDITSVADFDDIITVFDAKTQLISLSSADKLAYADINILANVLYKNSSGEIDKFEFSSPKRFEFSLGDNENISDLTFSVKVLSFKVKAGKEIEAVVEVEICYQKSKLFSTQFVSAYEIVGEKSEDGFGIKVYVSKGNEGLFDVSKALNVKPETIAIQNEVDGEFEKGQKIYVYSPINLS